jgi:DNA-binding transcriptional LysR family regulator
VIDRIYHAMRLQHLTYLTALARERHFGRAAAACRVSQPTLSSGIRRLEGELGVRIVQRTQRFEGLTPEGERVLTWARRILADCEGLESDVGALRGGLTGQVRLGAIPTALPAAPFLTRALREGHPNVVAAVLSLTSRDIERELREYELHAGLTYLDNEPLAHVDTLPLWHERYLLVAPADGGLGGDATASWSTAAELPLCLLTPDMQHRRIVDAAFESAHATPQPAVETNSVSTLIAHARAGLPGITAHTWLDANPLPDDLRALPLTDPEVEHTIGLVTVAGTQRTPVITELLSLFSPLELADDAPPRRSGGR